MKNKLNINEIFYSIQGEGKNAGKPCVFIRLQGCNLRCEWCDTKYAWNTNENIIMSFDEIIKEVDKYDCHFVEFTGGEPLLQENFIDLAQFFLDKEYMVAVETSGSKNISNLPADIIKIMDIKCPSSGMSENNLFENFSHLNIIDEIKFVIADEKDYHYAKRIIEKYKLNQKVNHIALSPSYGLLDGAKLAELILNDHLDVSLGLQLHKYLWDPEERRR